MSEPSVQVLVRVLVACGSLFALVPLAKWGARRFTRTPRAGFAWTFLLPYVGATTCSALVAVLMGWSASGSLVDVFTVNAALALCVWRFVPAPLQEREPPAAPPADWPSERKPVPDSRLP